MKKTGAGGGTTGKANSIFATLAKGTNIKLQESSILSFGAQYNLSHNLFTKSSIFNRGIVARVSDDGTFLTGSLTRFVKATQQNNNFYLV